MTRVAVVGAGLSGLTCALRLAERGVSVTLFEASVRSGGKAGAQILEGHFEDHGFHFFAGWYHNTWQLVDELGLKEHFLDLNELVDLRRGEFPVHRVIHNQARISWRTFSANVRSGFLSLPDLFLFHYSSLELLAEPFSQRRFLDQISVQGFMASRFYTSAAICEQHNEVLFKSISNPSYLVSAMTYQKMLAFWAGSPDPMFRMLRTDLHHGLIEPILSKLVELGVSLHFEHRLVAIESAEATVSSLGFSTPATTIEVTGFDAYVLSIPHESLSALTDDALYVADPALGGLRKLRSEPMAAVTVYCKKRLENIPSRHVICRGSTLGLSFVDIGQVWPGLDRTVLSIVAADYTALKGLSHAAATQIILDELRAYVPTCTATVIERVVLQPHVDEPLFMNDVGVWSSRPTTSTRLRNCFIAGDYCQTEIDLVSMEGAIVSGLNAANAVMQTTEITATLVSVISPSRRPRWILVLAKYLLLPLAWLAWCARTLTRPVSPRASGS